MAEGLLRICGPDGLVRGLGFVADRQGSVLTARQAVEGMEHLVLHLPCGQTRVLGADCVELLPGPGLAVLRTDSVGGLPLAPQAIADGIGSGLVSVSQLTAGIWELAQVQGAIGRVAPDGALLLELPQLRLPLTPGAPVLDAETGAVLGVLVAGPDGPRALPPTGPALAELRGRNAEAVPAYGRALNLGGVLALCSVQLGSASAGPGRIADLAADRVDRPDGLTGAEPGVAVSVLVGPAGSGRSTELAALAVRRAGGPRPLPTVWLRGADLAPEDHTLAAAAERQLGWAAALLDVPAPSLDELVRRCTEAGRPLLVVLDAPEEAPFAVPGEWLAASARWLEAAGVRLLTACRAESWGDGLPGAVVHGLGPLPAEAGVRVARRYGAPEPGEHPLALRLAGELGETAERGRLYAAYLELCCTRAAQRLRAENGPRRAGAHRRGTAVAPPVPEGPEPLRGLAATLGERVGEAASRMLGTGHGTLDAAAFAALFPAEGGWAGAVLAERLFVPAGPGYRFAHEDLADWLQGSRLDLDAALRLLLEGTAVPAEAVLPAGGVPRHRAGVVAWALRGVGERHGAVGLDPWLWRLWRGVETAPGPEPAWWARRLLLDGLAGSPELALHRPLLAAVAERGGGGLGAEFWVGLPLPLTDRLELLRLLVTTDQEARAAVAELLRADPRAVVPLLCRWFGETRGSAAADLAHDLLWAHRRLAVDDLTESLAIAAHPRADALLAELAVAEPSALCRAVDRWSHDPRPEWHVAAAVHALRAAPYATGTGADLLRHTARTLLAREEEPTLHGAALALLVRDPVTRGQQLPAALAAYRRDDPFVTAEALAPALATDPEPVLAAFRRRLATPGGAVAEALRVLAGQDAPELLGPGLDLAAELLHQRPERSGQVAEYLAVLLDGRPEPELDLLLAEAAARPPGLRRVLAVLLTDPERPPRLLEMLLVVERDPVVLVPVVERLADCCRDEQAPGVRQLIRLMAEAGGPEVDAALVRGAGRSADFARLLAHWPTGEPGPRGGPLLARMRLLVAGGRDPQYAAAEAERGAVVRQVRPAGRVG
ncbi:serine protease [Kitasatospora sp. P5_F3]